MTSSTRLGIILAIVLISGTLGSTALVFADDDNEGKKYLKNSLNKICKDKKERKTWYCIAFDETKGNISEIIQQIKKNTDDINQINEDIMPNTLESCNGANEVLRFTEGQGWTCEKLDIPRFECSGHGTILDGSDTCECNEGFTGVQCDKLTVFPAGTIIQQIKPSACDGQTGHGWCPDGTLISFKIETIPGAKLDSALVISVENSPMGNCDIGFRQTTKMFEVNCLSAPPADSTLKYVVLIP